MVLLKNQPLWKKFGTFAVLLYLLLTVVLLLGSLAGLIVGRDNAFFGWGMLCLMVPVAWILKHIGINLIISTSYFLITLINVVVLFGVGSLIGYVMAKGKNRA